MPRAKMLAARAVVAALALGLVCSAAPGSAQRRRAVRVAVGELAGARSFDEAVDAALAAHEEVRVTSPAQADLVIRGSVVRWDRQRVGAALEVRCEVSMILADARGGSIRAMLRGRGGARGSAAPNELSRDALRAAVRGALRPLGTHGLALARR